MPLKFSVVTGSPDPVYRQIVEQVRVAIAGGVLQPGEQLPSVRALAELLVVNPNTVARAYNDLTGEGALEARPGKGVFVAQRRQVFAPEERLRRLEAAVQTLVKEVALLGFSDEEIQELLQRELQKLKGGEEQKR